MIIEFPHGQHFQLTPVRVHMRIIKMHKRVADPVNPFLYVILSCRVVGKDLLHQLQFDQIFQINTDLGP